jgi:predicted NUDIX family phosphoesterase
MALESVLVADALGEKDLAVVPRQDIIAGKSWSGVRVMSEADLFQLLSQHMIFRERTEELEKDESVKQIIPYFLVRRGDEYLTARRKNTGGDVRLHGGRLIGFGGHLRAGDIKGVMKDWLQREFEEEIEAEKVIGISFLGVVNHDGSEDNGVHKVHFGLVFEIKVEGEARLKEEDKFQEEEFMPIESLSWKREEMELWSRLVLDFIAQGK